MAVTAAMRRTKATDPARICPPGVTMVVDLGMILAAGIPSFWRIDSRRSSFVRHFRISSSSATGSRGRLSGFLLSMRVNN
jgi:hypothetical protein